MSDSTACNDPQAGTTSSGADHAIPLPLFHLQAFRTMVIPEMEKPVEACAGSMMGEILGTLCDDFTTFILLVLVYFYSKAPKWCTWMLLYY